MTKKESRIAAVTVGYALAMMAFGFVMKLPAVIMLPAFIPAAAALGYVAIKKVSRDLSRYQDGHFSQYHVTCFVRGPISDEERARMYKHLGRCYDCDLAIGAEIAASQEEMYAAETQEAPQQ